MKRTAAFDLDGTLAHTAPDLVGAANALLMPRGLPEMPVEAAGHTAGFGAKALIRKAYELDGREAPEDEVDALYQPFLDAYAERLCIDSALYPGTLEALDGLAADGWVLTVCTNKPEALAEGLLAALGVRDRFGALIGADTLPERKPHPSALWEAVERAGGSRGRAVMIGDTDTDLKTAQACAMPCILTTFGYSRPCVTTLGADAVVERFAEIPDALERLLPA